MGDIKMPDSTPCQFDAKGWSPCQKPTDNGWCSEHEGLKCSSCGTRATHSCDAQMGGLACGANLCDNCTHGRFGDHITREAMGKILEDERAERQARIDSRTSPERRMNEELCVPATLHELLKGDWQKEGYALKKAYFLELKHTCIGCFPAVFSSDSKRVVDTVDLTLLERVWQTLEPREAVINERTAYANEEFGILYFESEQPTPESREKCEPQRFLTEAELEALPKEETPFRWAYGLVGERDLSEEAFLRDLSNQALKLNPQFASKKAA